MPELSRQESEPLVHKTFGDSFEGTDLEEVLASAGVGRLVVTGAQTDQCIRSTIHGAFTRGYDVTLVGDAHTTEDLTEWGAPPPDKVIAHTNMYWESRRRPAAPPASTETRTSRSPAEREPGARVHGLRCRERRPGHGHPRRRGDGPRLAS